MSDNLIVKRVDSPAGYNNSEYTPRDFDSYEIDRIKERAETVTHLVYWYSGGYYCGAGQLLCKTESGWVNHDCSHCSCYGPTCEFHNKPGQTLDEIRAAIHPHYLSEVEPLINAAREMEAK